MIDYQRDSPKYCNISNIHIELSNQAVDPNSLISVVFFELHCGQITIFEGDSREVIHQMEDNYYDIVFIDGGQSI